ncbi:ras suppressor protein 1-like [Anneissia japonica]|uniref:ras suppressor protein 1-like n=1 Tax=Anneissia japonica TaxID=1529436 RepID=UPI0014255BF2|nr:ras suppressor protein 1-like [Anneissia japonica]
MSKSIKKQVDEAQNHRSPELDLSDKNISKILDIPSLFSLADHLTRLTLSHNKIDSVPPAVVELHKLEVLNLFNNHIEELPTNFSSMQNLKRLNVGMNRLYHLPRGFGAFPKLEVLDLTYNNLSENSLSKNFFLLGTLRALYLSDNDFEVIPEEIGKLTQLKQLAIRDNDLISLPQAIGELAMLRELHIQGNRLTVLPPELGKLDLYSNQAVFRADNNPWVPPILDQFQVGVSHVFEYIRSDTYKYLYGRHMQAGAAPPPKKANKSKKICKKEIWGKK